MKKLKSKVTLINIISNIILQVVNVITGFIIPKIMLSYFGSNVNGLVSSITQFLSYISLVEGGISGVVIASLYKPLVDKDDEKLSSVIKSSNNFYRKIGLVFTLYTIILAFIYPLLFNKNFSYIYMFSLVLILSINLFIQYMFSLTLRNLLKADKKGYIVSLTQSLILILTVILTFISVKIYPSVHILKLLSSSLFLLQPIIFSRYVNKNYKIKKSSKVDNKLISQRWNGFAINLAAFIHNSTDITVLTFFTNLATVSIYSVYSIVTSGLKAIINAISSAIVPPIGKTYASGNFNELNKKMDLYEYIIFITVFYFFTIASLLITPFVMIYTSGINDANYNQFLFGILLVISEALYLIKFPHLNLSYSANKFKELTIPAFIEAFINIIVSLILVKRFGLIGVSIGTICGMTYRMMQQVKFTNKLIENRNQLLFYKKLLIFSISTVIGLIFCYLFIPLAKFNISSWIIHAIMYLLLFGTIYIITSKLFFEKEINYLLNYMKIRKRSGDN